MFRLREEVLAEAQLGKTRALRVRRSTKILLPPMPEQVHAKRQSTQTPDASSQCRRAREEEVQRPEEDVRSCRLSVRAARKKASPEDDCRVVANCIGQERETCAKDLVAHKVIIELKISRHIAHESNMKNMFCTIEQTFRTLLAFIVLHLVTTINDKKLISLYISYYSEYTWLKINVAIIIVFRPVARTS